MTFLLLVGVLSLATLTWEIPVEYELAPGQTTPDPLPRCADVDPDAEPPITRCLDKILIYHGMEVEISPGVVGYVFDQPVIEVDETVLEYVVEPQVEGYWFFAVTAVDREGAESVESGHVSKLITDRTPLPPVMVANEDEVVFAVIPRVDRFVLLPIGTVPAGTACDPTQSVNGHPVVPKAKVVWTNTDPDAVRPDAVVAKCDG